MLYYIRIHTGKRNKGFVSLLTLFVSATLFPAGNLARDGLIKVVSYGGI